MANAVRFLMTGVCVGIGEGVGFRVRTVGSYFCFVRHFEVPEIHMNLCMDL